MGHGKLTGRLLEAEEKRLSRIKQTRELIRTKGLSGQLNNTKWRELFDRVEDLRLIFEIKLLSENNLRHCTFIRELENTSILIDDNGDFIEFLEIELVKFKKDNKLTEHLNNLKVEYFDKADDLIIQGYAG